MFYLFFFFLYTTSLKFRASKPTSWLGLATFREIGNLPWPPDWMTQRNTPLEELGKMTLSREYHSRQGARPVIC